MIKYLIYGHQGWIGNQILELLSNHNVIKGKSRVDNDESLESEIVSNKPDRILCFIGRTSGPGIPNIDYLEQKGKLVENIRDNLYSPLILAILCKKYSIHLTYLGTGCIFDYEDKEHINESSGYTEKDKPNFFGSQYSVVKGFTDRIMHQFEDTVLNLRIRMPITDKDEPKNFVSKIKNFDNICSIHNSMTVLPELLPILIDMCNKKITGTYNFTNPGTISHDEILEYYNKISKDKVNYNLISLSDLKNFVKADRSNNKLDTSKLEELNSVTNINKSVKMVINKICL